jgi:hypothetical protein
MDHHFVRSAGHKEVPARRDTTDAHQPKKANSLPSGLQLGDTCVRRHDLPAVCKLLDVHRAVSNYRLL